MEPSPPSPVQLLSVRPLSSSAQGSPRLGETAPVERNGESPRTGLVSGRNGRRRTYGAVPGYHSSSFKRNNACIIEHILDEEDTLQGLALKYEVSVSLLQEAFIVGT